MSAHGRRVELKARVIEALGAGHTRTTAAALAGIHRDTIYAWLEADSVFSDALTRAEALALAAAEKTVAQAATGGDWRAALAYLERRDRANWGRRATIASEGTMEVRVVRVAGSRGGASGAHHQLTERRQHLSSFGE